MINKKNISPLQLIPDQLQRSSKSLILHSKRTQDQDEEKSVQCIKFLIKEKKSDKLKIGDVDRFRHLLRAGSSCFVFYIHQEQNQCDNVFLPLQKSDIKIPLIDPTLQVGIHIWNYIYNYESRNLNIYQFMCILGDCQEINKILLFVVSQLANKIIIIFENKSEVHLSIINQIKEFQYEQEIDIFHLISQNIQDYNQLNLEMVNYITFFENSLREKYFQTEFTSKFLIKQWAEQTITSATKKTFNGYDIDPFIILSILFYLKNINFRITNPNLIFLNSIKKQIEYSRKDIQEQYLLQIQRICSSSNQISQASLMNKLNIWRNLAQQQFFQQLGQFQGLDDYEKSLSDLNKFISNIEEDTLNHFHIINHYDIQQTMKKNLKSIVEITQNNDTFLNHYNQFYTLLLNLDDVMGVKFKYLKRYFKRKHQKILTFHILQTYLHYQLNEIVQLEQEKVILQEEIRQLQDDIEEQAHFEQITKQINSKRHTRRNSAQTTGMLANSNLNESIQKLNFEVENLQSRINVLMKN